MKLINYLSFLFMLFFITACSQSDSRQLKLGTNVWIGYEPLYLARETGILSKDTAHLIEYPSASEVIRAFRNRAIDVASLTLDEALILSQGGLPIKIILVHDVSNGADTILSRPEIKSIKELKGKRIAVESSALGAYVITRALELNNMTVNDVKIKHLDVNEHEGAYKNNTVDAVVNFEPVRTRLLNSGANEIFTSKEIYGEIVDVMVVHEDVYISQKDNLKTIIRSWFAALQYFKENRDSAAKIMANRLGISPAEVISSYDGLELPDLKSNIEMLKGKNGTLGITMKRLAKVLLDNNLIASKEIRLNILSEDLLK